MSDGGNLFPRVEEKDEERERKGVCFYCGSTKEVDCLDDNYSPMCRKCYDYYSLKSV